jgi:hypothetical protein
MAVVTSPLAVNSSSAQKILISNADRDDRGYVTRVRGPDRAIRIGPRFADANAALI